MIVLAWYLLKVFICSMLLFGYYFIALRNKTFHQWNRYYLLSAIVLSLTLPLIQVNVAHTPEDSGEIVRLITVVSQGDEFIIKANETSTLSLTAEQLLLILYTSISLVLLITCLRSAFTIFKIINSSHKQKIGKIYCIDSDAKGTPFSFLNFIVWNKNIDLNSETGKQIFQHEVVHVEEKHTLDKMFMLVVLIFFWINPLFWLIRRELNAIHEFIADEKSVSKDNTEAFIQMILTAVYPRYNSVLSNPFFQSSIKRRLLMFTKYQNPRITYISRILCLPVLVLVFAAFALKPANSKNVVISLGDAVPDHQVLLDTAPVIHENKKIENFEGADITPSLKVQTKMFTSPGTKKVSDSFVKPPPTEPVYQKAVIVPQFPGGLQSLKEFLENRFQRRDTGC